MDGTATIAGTTTTAGTTTIAGKIAATIVINLYHYN